MQNVIIISRVREISLARRQNELHRTRKFLYCFAGILIINEELFIEDVHPRDSARRDGPACRDGCGKTLGVVSGKYN